MTNNQAHAKLSASGSSKWLNCPGSINAEASYKEQTSGYADEGTLAHELADMCIKDRVNADTRIGSIVTKTFRDDKGNFIRSIECIVTKEMADNVQEYIDYVFSHETKNTILFSEERLDFSNIVPEGFGTMDAAVYDPDTGICHIFDLKYGKGVMVDAFENTQGQLYAIGFLNEFGFLYDIKSFTIHICQPRKQNFSSWEISVADLNTFSKWVTERAELALTKDAPRIPGEKQCQWCKAKNDCKALANFAEQVIKCEFDKFDKDEVDTNILTDADKKAIIDNMKLITDFLNSVYKETYDRMCQGESFNGYKLVEGRSNRTWGDDAESYLAEKLGDDAYTKKLIGVTLAQKYIGKEKVDELTYKPPGKLTMAPDYDKRKAVLVKDIALYFSNTEENNEEDE